MKDQDQPIWDSGDHKLGAVKRGLPLTDLFDKYRYPKSAEIYSNLASILIGSGATAQALNACRIAICLNPALFEAGFNLALCFREVKEIELACHWYQRSIRLQPAFARSWKNIGNVFVLLGREDLAEASFTEAIRLDSDDVMARVNLANLLQHRKELRKSQDLLHEAILLEPSMAEAYGNLGNILREQKNHAAAEMAYRRSTAISPDFTEALSNSGNLLRDLGRLDEAKIALQKAICLRPEFADAYYNLGVTLYRCGTVEAAHRSYERAIHLKPDFAEAQLSRGFLFLAEGRYLEGWPYYETRFEYPGFGLRRRLDNAPEWDGLASLSGKSVLLYAEQGLGDTIQFSRFALVLEEMGARVTLEVQEPLKRLLKRLSNGVFVISEQDPKVMYDYQLPLMSLPYRLNTTTETIPSCPQSLKPPPDVASRWRNRLGVAKRPRVGLVLSGNPEHVNDCIRSIPWCHIEKFLSLDVEFVCLQKELRSGDLKFIHETGGIRFFCDSIRDFVDTAALCMEMDLVLSVDTSVAHLAATLGRPTWVMLPSMPDWRWMIDRNDSVWYPTVKLFRKGFHESWECFFEMLGKEIDSKLRLQ